MAPVAGRAAHSIRHDFDGNGRGKAKTARRTAGAMTIKPYSLDTVSNDGIICYGFKEVYYAGARLIFTTEYALH